MRCLVIRFSAMGDVALTLPAVQSALNSNPNLEIVFVSNKAFAPFYQGVRSLEFYAADLKNQHKGLLGLYKLSRELKTKYRFDCVIDLHSVLRSFILSFFMGLPTFRINKGRKEKSKLLKDPINSPRPLKHTLQRYLDVFNQAHIKAPWPNNFGFAIAPENLKRATDIFNDLACSANTKIGIAPFSKQATKNWPLNKIEQLISKLNRKENTTVLLFGGPGKEAKALEELAKKFENVVNMAGKYNLSQEIACISQLQLMISMDSSNMHIAALSGTKVLSIWGGTDPAAGFSPMSIQQNIIIEIPVEKLNCRPCSIFGQKKCPQGHFKCMNDISVEQVLSHL